MNSKNRKRTSCIIRSSSWSKWVSTDFFSCFGVSPKCIVKTSSEAEAVEAGVWGDSSGISSLLVIWTLRRHTLVEEEWKWTQTARRRPWGCSSLQWGCRRSRYRSWPLCWNPLGIRRKKSGTYHEETFWASCPPRGCRDCEDREQGLEFQSWSPP